MGGTGLEPVTPSLSIRPDALCPVVSYCAELRKSPHRGVFDRQPSTFEQKGKTRVVSVTGTAQALRPATPSGVRTPAEQCARRFGLRECRCEGRALREPEVRGEDLAAVQLDEERVTAGGAWRRPVGDV